MSTTQTDKMIARRTRLGYNADESKALLGELLARHTGDNLVYFLVYLGFATERAATQFAA